MSARVPPDKLVLDLLKAMDYLLEECHLRGDAEILAHGVTVAQYHVLLAIEEAGKPVPMQLISKQLDVSATTATRLVDQLVQQGLVTRSGDSIDRRVVRVRLTSRGQVRLAQVKKTRMETERLILSFVGHEHWQPLLRHVSLLADATAQWRALRRRDEQKRVG